jgi:hypothetical protein
MAATTIKPYPNDVQRNDRGDVCALSTPTAVEEFFSGIRQDWDRIKTGSTRLTGLKAADDSAFSSYQILSPIPVFFVFENATTSSDLGISYSIL